MSFSLDFFVDILSLLKTKKNKKQHYYKNSTLFMPLWSEQTYMFSMFLFSPTADI